jgi:hypothetical protein
MKEIFRLTAAAIVKDEAAYIEEWLAYHILIGFEHFYIFDNGSTDDTAKVLAPYIKYGYVTYIHWPVFPGQFDAYGYAAKIFGVHSRWMAFIDIDEFFVLKQHDSMPAFLDTIDADQVLILWRFFGHSGHRTKPNGLVIENYNACEPEISHMAKCIVRPARVFVMFVHNSSTDSGRTVNDAGVRIREDWVVKAGFRSEQFVCLNHYFTKSYEEYEHKISRGRVSGRNKRTVQPFEQWDFAHQDLTLATWAGKVRDLMVWFRGLPEQPYRYGALTSVGRVSNCRNFTLLSQEMALEYEALVSPPQGIARLVYGTGVQISASVGSEAACLAADALIDKYLNRIGADCLFRLTEQTVKEIGFSNSEPLSAGLPLAIAAQNADPYIRAAVSRPEWPGYVIAIILLRVPKTSSMDLFAFGRDLHGEPIRESRRVRVDQGLWFGSYMINDTPFAPDIVRCDPGSVPGAYEIMRMVFAIVR